MPEKILSIIVPAYNMEAYLPKCLGSLIIDDKDLLQKLDVIVVNDGSKDRTSEIAHEFEAKYPGIFRVIDKENGHYGSCINAAIKIASGTYVKLLDADDSFDTGLFADYMSFLIKAKGNGIDLVLTDGVKEDENGKRLGVVCCGVEANQILDSSRLTEVFLKRYIYAIWVTYRLGLLKDMDYRQSEGMPYTDTQWAVLPMANVKTAIYKPILMYRYLKGRIDQSTSPSAPPNNMWMSALKRTNESLRQYLKLSNTGKIVNDAFVSGKIIDTYKCVYADCILRFHSRTNDIELKKIDSEFRLISEDYYNMVGAARILRNTIPYIRVWRSRFNSNMLVLRLARLIYRVLNFRKAL